MIDGHSQTLPSLSIVDPGTAPLEDCVRFVLDRFHGFQRSEMARLPGALRDAAQAHPELAASSRTFEGLVAELEGHFDKEERILLPYIAALEGAGGPPRAPFPTLEAPLRVMTMEHDAAKNAIATLREQMHDFATPADPALGPLRDALRVFCGDVLAHIDYEDVLFPRAVRVESARRAR
jgi:iron-sulfur cluster repair protein YtfE (RIC family)